RVTRFVRPTDSIVPGENFPTFLTLSSVNARRPPAGTAPGRSDTKRIQQIPGDGQRQLFRPHGNRRQNR
ncbi:hypothetical protein CDAR_482571, partial [Caerostris darwini]